MRFQLGMVRDATLSCTRRRSGTAVVPVEHDRDRELIAPISRWREANTVGQHDMQERPSLGNVPAQEFLPVVQEATKLRAQHMSGLARDRGLGGTRGQSACRRPQSASRCLSASRMTGTAPPFAAVSAPAALSRFAVPFRPSPPAQSSKISRTTAPSASLIRRSTWFRSPEGPRISYLPEAFTSDPDRLADREMAFKELEVEDEHIKGICSLMEEIRDR